jgi:hypothetical protein
MCGARYLGVQPLYICCVEVVVLVDVKPRMWRKSPMKHPTLNASPWDLGPKGRPDDAYFRPNIEMRPCEKVRSAKSRTRYVRPMAFLHTSYISWLPRITKTLKQLGAVTQEQAILVGGRVGNVACEDQVRLCHLSGVQAEAWEHLQVQVGQYGRSPFFTLERPLLGHSVGVPVKAYLGRRIVRLRAVQETPEGPETRKL